MVHEFRKLRASFRAAWKGISLAIRSERNFRIHLCTALYVSLLAIVGGVPIWQLGLIALCFGVMISAELFNTAIELACDAISARFDKTLGTIKDISAAAVLVCAAFCAVCGILIFIQHGVISAILAAPWVFIVIVLTLPLALWFIFRK
ncbi:MAG: diacylglycerol kinase family protein [Clostridia bacterium]